MGPWGTTKRKPLPVMREEPDMLLLEKRNAASPIEEGRS